MRLASASVALYVCTTHPRCTCSELAAVSMYGASTSHFPPAEGMKSPRNAEYTPTSSGKVCDVDTSMKNSAIFLASPDSVIIFTIPA